MRLLLRLRPLRALGRLAPVVSAAASGSMIRRRSVERKTWGCCRCRRCADEDGSRSRGPALHSVI